MLDPITVAFLGLFSINMVGILVTIIRTEGLCDLEDRICMLEAQLAACLEDTDE